MTHAACFACGNPAKAGMRLCDACRAAVAHAFGPVPPRVEYVPRKGRKASRGLLGRFTRREKESMR